MNFVLAIVNPEEAPVLLEICKALLLPIVVEMHAHGTATRGMMDLLGIESREKRVALAVAGTRETRSLMQEMRDRLYMGMPGRGIVVAVPVKSVGGGRTLAYLSGGKPEEGAPKIRYSHEMLVVIANEGHTDDVMDAARAAGATGGTILHGKGANARKAEEFFNVSIAAEREVVLIVACAEHKAAIMRSILENAGVETPAGAIVFSLPVSEVGGFKLASLPTADPEQEP